jgi:hypothetical protein
MGNYDSIDLDWAWDGDYITGSDGDIGDTSDDYVRSLETEIGTVAKSALLDWERDPTIGAQLDDYVGEANTRETGGKIEDRLRFQIIDAGLVRPEDLAIRAVPIGIYRIMVVITVTTLATSNNRLEVSDPVVVTLVFDTTEQSVMVLPNLRPYADFGGVV